MKVFKEIISIVLLVAITTVTMGITLHYHFCSKSQSLAVNIIETVECHCKPIEISSCCAHGDEHNTCSTTPSNDTSSNQSITHDKCCLDYSTTINFDETFLTSSFKSITLKNHTTFVINKLSEIDTFKRLKTWEKRLKIYYTGFKQNIIRFIRILSSLDKKDLPDDSL